MSKKINNTGAGKLPRIKKGDQVIVITGADKDMQKARRVIAVYPKTGRVLVEGVRVVKRAYKKGMNAQLPEGGIHEKQLPISLSNVMLADPKDGGPTRVGISTETDKNGKTVRVRYAKKSGTTLKS